MTLTILMADLDWESTGSHRERESSMCVCKEVQQSWIACYVEGGESGCNIRVSFTSQIFLLCTYCLQWPSWNNGKELYVNLVTLLFIMEVSISHAVEVCGLCLLSMLNITISDKSVVFCCLKCEWIYVHIQLRPEI